MKTELLERLFRGVGYSCAAHSACRDWVLPGLLMLLAGLAIILLIAWIVGLYGAGRTAHRHRVLQLKARRDETHDAILDIEGNPNSTLGDVAKSARLRDEMRSLKLKLLLLDIWGAVRPVLVLLMFMAVGKWLLTWFES